MDDRLPGSADIDSGAPGALTGERRRGVTWKIRIIG